MTRINRRTIKKITDINYSRILYDPPPGFFFVSRLLRWHSDKESTWQCSRYKRPGFDPWVRKIPSSRK